MLEELLAAIRAHPEDDGPWEVCADWLEEQGDARARGLRLLVAQRQVIRRVGTINATPPTKSRNWSIPEPEVRPFAERGRWWAIVTLAAILDEVDLPYWGLLPELRQVHVRVRLFVLGLDLLGPSSWPSWQQVPGDPLRQWYQRSYGVTVQYAVGTSGDPPCHRHHHIRQMVQHLLSTLHHSAQHRLTTYKVGRWLRRCLKAALAWCPAPPASWQPATLWDTEPSREDLVYA